MSYKFLIGGVSIYRVKSISQSQNNFILKFFGLIYKISFVHHVKIQELLVF